MAIFGEMIKGTKVKLVDKVDLEYLAEQLFNGVVHLPHFEFLESTDPATGKVTHSKGYRVYLEPSLVSALTELIKKKAETDKKPDVDPFGKKQISFFESTPVGETPAIIDPFRKELTEVSRGTMREETPIRALSNLIGPAVIREANNQMQRLKLGPAKRFEISKDIKRLSTTAIKAAAKNLRVTSAPERYNTAFLINSFRNRFLCVPFNDALISGAADIVDDDRKTIDGLILNFFRDKKNHENLEGNEDLMEYLESLVLRTEEPEEYFRKLTEVNDGIFAPVISPFVAQMLFNENEFPKFTEMLTKEVKRPVEKVDDLKRKYEKFLKRVYKAAFIEEIEKRITISDKPTQMNISKYLRSPLRITSPIIGFDIVGSSDIVNYLGEDAPDFLNIQKNVVFSYFEPYDAEYLNDMGDGQFGATASVENAIYAAYNAFEKFRKPGTKDKDGKEDPSEAKKEILKRFGSELESLEKGVDDLSREITGEKAKSPTDELYSGGRSIRIISESEKMKKLAQIDEAGHVSDDQKKLTESREIADKLFPEIRITIVYDHYKMPKIENSTATGRAAYRVSRGLGSEGKPEHALVELRKGAHEANCVYHEGILLLKEAIDSLKRELGGEDSFVESDISKGITRMYRNKTGNNDAIVYEPNGLKFKYYDPVASAYKRRQIYLAYLGKADIKSYKNEEIWAVLTEEDFKRLGIPRDPIPQKPQTPKTSTQPITITEPKLSIPRPPSYIPPPIK